MSGEIVPQGAKNEALQVICAVLLTPEKVTITNIPDILDVNNLIQLLRDMQVKVERLSLDTYAFQADNVDLDYLKTEDFVRKSASLRGSVMIVGPLLARFGKAVCQNLEVIRSDAEDWILILLVYRSSELLLHTIRMPSFMKLKRSI